jgi:molybdopterin-guanine dinucleotide biosynthesis protein A
MGSDKALLTYAGETLLERALGMARDACGSVFICGSRARYQRFGDLLEDVEPGLGPLSGIHAALHATQTSLNLILSVDMPLMQSAFLKWLLERGRAGAQMITTPEASGKLQPLCAIYRREVISYVDEALAAREYKVTALFRRAATRVISEEEIRVAGFSPMIFTNTNTPEEYSSLIRSEFSDSPQPKVLHE